MDGAKIALANFISFKRLPGLIAFSPPAAAAATVFCERARVICNFAFAAHSAPAVSMLIKINPHSIKAKFGHEKEGKEPAEPSISRHTGERKRRM
jgi:hypothetical protein